MKIYSVLRLVVGVLFLVSFASFGCSFNVGLNKKKDLKEVKVAQEDGKDKILLLPIDGMISLEPKGSFFGSEPGMVVTLREQLDKAREEDDVKAVLLRVNSPGGTLGATQMIHDELVRFKKETGKFVLALYLETAASGALYLSMAADQIMAYPSAITGSMGVLFISPNFEDLGKKIGIDYRVVKTGSKKDMGTPFRSWPAEEQKLLTELAAGYNEQFKSVVFKSRETRGMTTRDLEILSDARILSAKDALKLHLIDEVGTLGDAIGRIEKKNGRGQMKLVAYTHYPDEVKTAYSRTYGLSMATSVPAATASGTTGMLETVLQGLGSGAVMQKGFYYIW